MRRFKLLSCDSPNSFTYEKFHSIGNITFQAETREKYSYKWGILGLSCETCSLVQKVCIDTHGILHKSGPALDSAPLRAEMHMQISKLKRDIGIILKYFYF